MSSARMSARAATHNKGIMNGIDAVLLAMENEDIGRARDLAEKFKGEK